MSVNPTPGSGGLGISNPSPSSTSSGTSSASPASSPTAQSDAATAAATDQKADAKASEQSKNCSGGKCGSQVPGECCEWMSKFNIACQKALRPYTNSCGNCGGSGGTGGNMCQACNGTGLENSTGGGFSQGVLLIKVLYLQNDSDMREIYGWFGVSTADELVSKMGTSFEWKGHCVVSLNKASVSLDINVLNSLPKAYYRVIHTFPHSYYFISPSPFIIYVYNGNYYALQSDLNRVFPEGNF